MKRSDQRILTTHCGSLPRPEKLVALLAARDLWQPVDMDDLAREVRQASVSSVVRRQVVSGLDVINDGEHSNTNFSSYVAARLGGLTPLHAQFGVSG